MGVHIISSIKDAKFLEANKRDPATYKTFKGGDTVIVCSKCEEVQLVSTWQEANASMSKPQNTCYKCHSSVSKDMYSLDPLVAPKKIKRNTNSKNEIDELMKKIDKKIEELERQEAIDRQNEELRRKREQERLAEQRKIREAAEREKQRKIQEEAERKKERKDAWKFIGFGVVTLCLKIFCGGTLLWFDLPLIVLSLGAILLGIVFLFDL